ncbi:MAG: futalosine hydrolase [Bacteroidota bacterium]
MKILLLSATQQEIQPFLLTLESITVKPDVLIGGLGTTATAYHLTKQLHHHYYDLVIQAGVAGVFEGSRNAIFSKNGVSDAPVVIVKQDCFADLGAIEQNQFQSIQQMGFSNEPEWYVNYNHLLNKLPYQQVKAITVSTVTDDADTISRLQQKWAADIESMEGSALHYVCHHQQTNYLQLRSISNTVGVRDKTQWKIKEAIENLNTALTSLIVMLNS